MCSQNMHGSSMHASYMRASCPRAHIRPTLARPTSCSTGLLYWCTFPSRTCRRHAVSGLQLYACIQVRMVHQSSTQPLCTLHAGGGGRGSMAKSTTHQHRVWATLLQRCDVPFVRVQVKCALLQRALEAQLVLLHTYKYVPRSMHGNIPTLSMMCCLQR